MKGVKHVTSQRHNTACDDCSVGTQGSMIAFRNAVYGKEVTGYSRTRTSIEKCRSKIRKWLNYYVETGRLSQAEADAAEQRISYAESLEDACKNAQLVVENVPEKLEVKQEIFVVCGTNGKTTTNNLLSSVLEAKWQKSGLQPHRFQYVKRGSFCLCAKCRIYGTFKSGLCLY